MNISFFREKGLIAEVGAPQMLVKVPRGDEVFLNRVDELGSRDSAKRQARNQSLLQLAQQNLTALNITFNGATKAVADAQYPIEKRLVVRLLLSYFHPTARHLADLMSEIHSSPLFKNLTIKQALDAIIWVLYICIDDVAGIVKTTDLKSMMEVLGMLAVGGISQYFLISIVCGTIFSSVQKVLGKSSHPFVNISLPSLREVDLEVLCQYMMGLDRWKSFSKQEMLLIKHRMSEISINPGLLGRSSQLYGSSSGELSDALDRIREETIHRINQRLANASAAFSRVMRVAIIQRFIINDARIAEELVDLESRLHSKASETNFLCRAFKHTREW
eukprot:gene26117-34726_t